MQSSRITSRRVRGFTLVELLVVIGVIAVLVSMLLPALGRARQQAAAVACLANLHQIGLANEQYRTTYKNWFAPLETTYHGSWGYSGGYNAANFQDKEARWFHYLNRFINNYSIFNCTTQNESRTAYNRPGADTQVKQANGDGTPFTWIIVSTSSVGASSNYAYNGGTLGFAALLSTVPYSPKEQYGARSYSQIRQLTRDAGTDMAHLIVVSDGAYAVRQLSASIYYDGLLDPYRWVHPGPRINILFGDSHVEGKMAKELKSKSVPTATRSVTYNANVLFAQ